MLISVAYYFLLEYEAGPISQMILEYLIFQVPDEPLVYFLLPIRNVYPFTIDRMVGDFPHQ